MIKYKRIITNISEYQTETLPINAEKMKAPITEEMMKKAAPIAVVLCVIMFFQCI